ncbi:hypothetical protein BDZ97DRAFT_1924825 [Flammula alnicola]|nr:hypothetical protein BDZ97DRAFT_1924825 [Flammula alnicola]
MATLLSPTTLSSTPNPKKSVFSSGSSSRRQSTSSVNVTSSPQILQGIGYSPGSTGIYHTHTASPAGSGIPSFRTLRSLLPFGPSKNATPTSTSTSPNTSRSPFASFGSVRRSMTKERERKISLSNDAMPVISIGRSKDSPVADETAIRRSVSLSRLEKPLPRHPNFDGSFRDESMSASESGFILRTPSPGPPLSAELSTIIEADSSGVSKHVPFLGLDGTPAGSRSSSPPAKRNLPHTELSSRPRKQGSSGNATTSNHRKTDSEWEADTSALDLPTDHLADQVLEAMRNNSSSTKSAKQWLEADKDVVIIDGDEHPEVADTSFNLETVDPDLLALLSPNSGSKNASPHSIGRRSEPNHQTPSPTTPTFPPSPASTSRLPRTRQGTSSLLPRLRSSQSPSTSPTSPRFSIPTPSPTTTSPTTPKAAPAKPRTPTIAVNGDDYSPSSPPGSPPSPGLSSTTTSTPARRTMNIPRSTKMFSPSSSSSSYAGSRTTKVFSGLIRPDAKTPPAANGSANPPRPVTRTLRQVMLGSSSSRTNDGGTSADSSSPSSSAVTILGRGSLDARRPPTSNSNNAAMMNDIGLGRPSLEIRRGSFDSRTRPFQQHKETYVSRSSTSPERTNTNTNGASTEVDSSPSPEMPFEEPQYRPSFDSVRQSFETSSRPGSVARLRERDRDGETQRTPSLRVTDTAGQRLSPIPRGAGPRVRKRSMSVQDRFPKGRFMAENGGMVRPGSSLSAHGGRGARGGFATDGEGGSGQENGGSGGSGGVGLGPKMEWLGPRTAKAFRAAGLLDFEREREKDRERDGSDTTERMMRNRSGSVGGVPSPSPLGGGAGGGAGTLGSAQNRFASIRSASEYNPTQSRAHSRLAFSEAGGVTSGHAGRRGSGSFSAYGGSVYGGGSPYGYAGLMESPTFTVSSSSRERDTPKSSTSTAPTSLSESFGYLGRDRTDRDRERDREEIRELKEKHGTEMGALLGALSDSQRTVRMLREENSQLRERLDRFSSVGQENDELRQTCDSLQSECIGLRREHAELQRELASLRALRRPSGLAPSWSQTSTSSGFRTPVQKPGNSSPLAMDTTPQFLRQEDDEEEYNNTIIIHDSIDGQPQFDVLGQSTDNYDAGPSDAIMPSSSSTPSLKRRLSNTSSIFPVPPANMTMLLHEDSTANMGDSNRSSADNSQYHFIFSPTVHPASSFSSTAKPIAAPQPKSPSRSLSKSPPITYRNFAGPGHQANKSITSTTSISPTTANFSMVTGSPGSLFLRPEHELLLGDMESLDLGVRGADTDAGSINNRMASEDGW